MEEFSFPAVAEEKEILCQFHFPHYASSPLWFLCSNSNHHVYRQRSRSFSSLEDLKLQEKKSSTEFSDEERMDKLWENFNEEIHHVPCGRDIGGKKGSESSRALTKLDDEWQGAAGELLCVKAVHRRRPGLVMLLKVFKKLILIQKFRRMRTASTYHM